MKVHLLASHGKFVTAELGEPDAPLTANRDVAGPWETFVQVAPSSGYVILLADNDCYVSCQPDGAVVANRRVIGPWETLVPRDGGLFCAAHGRFLTAELGQPPRIPVTCTRTEAGPWEQFTLTPVAVPAPDTWPPLRSDFLTAQNARGQYLNSGEYPALSASKRAEVRGVWKANGYTTLLMESDWPGDDTVPPFSWTTHPEKFLACLPELLAAGIEPVLLIGLEGFKGRHVDPPYIEEAGALAKHARDAGVKTMVVGIESEEFTYYTTEYRPLVKAVGPSAETLLTHFHGGVLAHPGDQVNGQWVNTPTVTQFYKENPEITGLLFQFDKQAHAGRFLVPDTDLVAQLASARRRLPKHLQLHAGEYANLVSQAKAQHAGDVCGSLGYNCWNGIGRTPHPAAVDPFVPVADAIPLSAITFTNMHGDCTALIRSWPVSATLLDVTITRPQINFPNTASGRWTLANTGILGNIWEVAETAPGRYTAQPWDYIVSFDFQKEWLGSGFPGHGPRWSLLTGPAREKFDGEKARTNIVRVT